MPTPHERQRPRSTSQERTGTLSYQAISAPQAMQAEGGETTDRRSGTRAATTFRNEPSAWPGARARAASPTSRSAAPAARLGNDLLHLVVGGRHSGQRSTYRHVEVRS